MGNFTVSNGADRTDGPVDRSNVSVVVWNMFAYVDTSCMIVATEKKTVVHTIDARCVTSVPTRECPTLEHSSADDTHNNDCHEERKRVE